MNIPEVARGRSLLDDRGIIFRRDSRFPYQHGLKTCGR